MNQKALISALSLAGLLMGPLAQATVAMPMQAQPITIKVDAPVIAEPIKAEVPTSDKREPLKPGEITALDPQPEPPAKIVPVEAGKITWIMGTSGVSAPSEQKGINPQPEPPVAFTAPDTTDEQVQTATQKEKISQDKPVTVITTTAEGMTSETAAEVKKLTIPPSKIFTADFSKVSNLQVATEVKDGKVMYRLVLPNGKELLKQKDAKTALFDFVFDQAVEWQGKNARAVIAHEQVLSWGDIRSAIAKEPGVIGMPARLIVPETTTEREIKIIPQGEGAMIGFNYRDKDVQVPVLGDFKIEGKKLFLVNGEKSIEIKVVPFKAWGDLQMVTDVNEKVKILDMSLGLEEGMPMYGATIQEPFKLFGFLGMSLKSHVMVDGEGNVTEIHRPWYASLGKKSCVINAGKSLTCK